MRGGKRLFLREYRLPLRARDGALLQDFVKTLAVLRRVHMVGVRAEDFHAEIVERFGELNGRLAPNWTIAPSGFSSSTILVTYSGVSGSK